MDANQLYQRIERALSVAAKVPPDTLGAMAQLGYADKAREYAERMENSERKLEALWIIADVLQENDTEQAKVVLRRALETINELQNGDKPGALAAVTLALARLKDKNGPSLGLDVVSKIRDDDTKARSLAAVVQAMIRAQDQEGVFRGLAIVEEMNTHREEAFVVIVDAMRQLDAKEGLLQALSIAERITHDYEKAKALATVAWAQSLARDEEGLELTLTASRKLASGLDRVLIYAAKGLAQAGNVERACELATLARRQIELETPDYLGEIRQGLVELRLSDTWAVIAQALAERGRESEAREALARVRLDKMIRSMQWPQADQYLEETLCAVQAAAQLKDKGCLTQVLDAVIDVENELGVSILFNKVLVGIIEAIARLGDKEGLKHAEEAAGWPLVGRSVLKAHLWTALAWAWDQLGEREKAKDVIGRAWTAAYEEFQRFEYGGRASRFPKMESFPTLGEMLVRLGEKEEGRKALDLALEYFEGGTYTGEWTKSYQWYNIGRQVIWHYLSGGKGDTVADALAATVRGLITLDDKEGVARALDLTKGLKGIVGWRSREKYQALTAKAEAIARTEWLRRAEKALTRQKTVGTMATVALAQARFGNRSRAQDLLVEVLDGIQELEKRREGKAEPREAQDTTLAKVAPPQAQHQPMIRCPNPDCGALNPVGKRFCGDCSAPLLEPFKPAERKQPRALSPNGTRIETTARWAGYFSGGLVLLMWGLWLLLANWPTCLLLVTITTAPIWVATVAFYAAKQIAQTWLTRDSPPTEGQVIAQATIGIATIWLFIIIIVQNTIMQGICR